jgi:hypothetical protein
MSSYMLSGHEVIQISTLKYDTFEKKVSDCVLPMEKRQEKIGGVENSI